jgi:hypothetical protein
MEKRQQRTIMAFENVLIYLMQHPVEPEPPLLAGMRKSLRASIDRVRALGTTQMTALDLGGGYVEHRRRALRRDRLMPIVRIAKPLLKYAPGAAKVLTVPHARADALTVAGAALEIAKFLKPHRKLLVSAGYPATFLADLQHEARELALGAKQTAAARAARAKATSDIARELRKGMQTVTVIEGLVLLHHGRDKATVRFWKNRRRVGARVGRPPRRKGQRASRGDRVSSPMEGTVEGSLSGGA